MCEQTRNSPPLPSSNSSTYPSFDSGFKAFQATVTELFTVEHSSWIIVGIDGTDKRAKKNSYFNRPNSANKVPVLNFCDEYEWNFLEWKWMQETKFRGRWSVSSERLVNNYLFVSVLHSLGPLKKSTHKKFK